MTAIPIIGDIIVYQRSCIRYIVTSKPFWSFGGMAVKGRRIKGNKAAGSTKVLLVEFAVQQ